MQTYMKKSWVLQLIVLIILLSKTSSSSSQITNCFTDEQVKKIAFQLESRRLLMLDTSDYRLKISLLEDNLETLKETNIKINEKSLLKDYYIESLVIDLDTVQLINTSLTNKVNQMDKQNKRIKKFSIAGMVATFFTGILIAI